MESETHFAPAHRSSDEEILKEFEFIVSQKLFTEIYGSTAGVGAIIDQNRQVVFTNHDFLKLFGLKSIETILGKRPGEILSCTHAGTEPFGCGTSEACAYCGAVNAIIESQRTGEKTTKETRLSTLVDGKLVSWDLSITSTPINLSGMTFYVLTLQDISNEKRRAALERIFFHDLLNSAGGLNGLLGILMEGTNPEDVHELIKLSEEASRDIVEEILLHRQIRAAEAGDLKVKIEEIGSWEFMHSTIGKISSHEVGKNKLVVFDQDSDDIRFETDRILIQRVIINLLKNALEATALNGRVFTGIESKDDRIRIWVKNDGVIPEEVQLQLFQRSYSTKGENRGIGTYSIKLIVENYLWGKVSFISREDEGTVFSIEINKAFSK